MNIDLPAGKYVVAVSGGVDSVALLHILKDLPGVKLTVAHYDHGIRTDSAEDRRLVQSLAREYGLPFVYKNGKLGANVSEAVARQARYDFLHHVKKVAGADSIITAHHADDVLETIVLNLLRGTGRRGLSSLKSTDLLRRPLLSIPKSQLRDYAQANGLKWREDSTNSNERYSRNYIRAQILPKFSEEDKARLLDISRTSARLNAEINQEIAHYLHLQTKAKSLDRHDFIMLPHAVAREVMAEWLLANAQAELSRKLLERLVSAAKTAKSGSKVDVNKHRWMAIGPDRLTLTPKA